MKPECFTLYIMYSADGCCEYPYDMDCYEHWLEYMLKTKEKVNAPS